MSFLRASLAELETLSRERQWSLDRIELKAIQDHFKKLKREPTDVELETLAQTWSEHCKHKTLTSPLLYKEGGKARRFKNLLKETIFDATRRLKKPWCLSVFKDNAGIVALDKDWALAFKVETHNHPSAIEPYGGAATGAGGVIRDVLGAGLGAKPVMNTDVFCVGPLDHEGDLPEGFFPPRRTLRQITAGVRDYGNRMGIPTANGGLAFDPGFLTNPLVFCGTVGVIPRKAVKKSVRPGDLIVAVGGRTGRDGLHGATFSSAALDDAASVSAVQIGNAIEEKKFLDVLLQARDKGLYRGVTDCGAGGFSSAIGELGAEIGAEVRLETAPLKHEGLKAWEIWLSESQERMVLAVPPSRWPALKSLFDAEDVEAVALGTFKKTGRLQVYFKDELVADLSMKFLHEGLPRYERRAEWSGRKNPHPPSGHPLPQVGEGGGEGHDSSNLGSALKALLSHPNICSREWIVRQYDHEVQGQTIGKPFQGPGQGPGDAAVIWPVTTTGAKRIPAFAVSNGITIGAADPYKGAVAAVDEALRNLAAAGADVRRAALLDNFCWGDPKDPRELGGLVRAALGCRDAALGYGAPFISGKDSLNNTYADASGRRASIPGTLLISALAPLPDPKRRMTMDLKGSGHAAFLVGPAAEGFVFSREVLAALFKAIQSGFVLACHDLSEGGLAVAAAEMAFAGNVGLELSLNGFTSSSDAEALFGEGLTRFLIEAAPGRERKLAALLHDHLFIEVGRTIAEPVLRARHQSRVVLQENLGELREAWSTALARELDGRRSQAPAPAREVAA